MVKPCDTCRWVGSGWFLFSPEHRYCKHPLVIAEELESNPAGNGRALVGIARRWGPCYREGRFWNTDRNGNPRA